MSLRPHCDNCLVKLGSVRTSKIIIDDEETMSVGLAISTLYETLLGDTSPLEEESTRDLLLCYSGCGEVLSQLLNCTLTLFRRMKEDCGVRKRVGDLRRDILKKQGEENVNIKQEVLHVPVEEEDGGCGGLSDGDGGVDDEDDFIPSEEDEDGDSDYDDGKNTKKNEGRYKDKDRGEPSPSSDTPSSTPKPCSKPSSAEYQCPQCPNHFKQLLPFYKHQQAHKEGKIGVTKGHRPEWSAKGKVKVPCTYPGCDKMIQKRNLQEHLRNRHTEARPYLCPTCGMSFKIVGGLRRHERTHQEVLPHPCPHCSKRFCRPADLKLHIESIHQFKGTVLCTVCGKEFIHEQNLKVHMKLHDESVRREELCCKLCSKVFSRKGNLRDHIKSVHEGVKYVKKSGGGGPPRNFVSKLKKNEEMGGVLSIR